MIWRTFCFILEKTVHFGCSPIESHYRELVVRNVQYQVLTHDSETDEAEITTRVDPRLSADIDAGETGAIVSLLI